jgi:hypothetical protein
MRSGTGDTRFESGIRSPAVASCCVPRSLFAMGHPDNLEPALVTNRETVASSSRGRQPTESNARTCKPRSGDICIEIRTIWAAHAAHDLQIVIRRCRRFPAVRCFRRVTVGWRPRLDDAAATLLDAPAGVGRHTRGTGADGGMGMRWGAGTLGERGQMWGRVPGQTRRARDTKATGTQVFNAGSGCCSASRCVPARRCPRAKVSPREDSRSDSRRRAAHPCPEGFVDANVPAGPLPRWRGIRRLGSAFSGRSAFPRT